MKGMIMTETTFPAEVSMPETFTCDCGQKCSNPAVIRLRPDGRYECAECDEAAHLELFRKLFDVSE